MRGVVGALVVAATAVAGVPVAVAGTYDVVSCGAPGAGGVNRAWQPEFGGFTDGTVTVPPDPSSYVIADQCPSQLLISSAPPDGTTAPFLTSGNWVFTAPSGNRITRLETWRFGVRLRTAANDSDPGTDGDQGDPWRVFARDEGAQLIGGVFGETCTAPAGAIGCSFGSDTGVERRIAGRLRHQRLADRVLGVLRDPRRTALGPTRTHRSPRSSSSGRA